MSIKNWRTGILEYRNGKIPQQWKTLFHLAIVLFMGIRPAGAQPEQPGDGTAAFQQAEQAVTLLRNEGGLIPLRGLDTLKIAYLSIGELPSEDFYPTLQRYLPVDKIPLPFVTKAKEAEAWLAELESAFNLLIVEIMDYTVGGQLPSSYQQVKLLEAIGSYERAIVVIHGDGAIFRLPRPWRRRRC